MSSCGSIAEYKYISFFNAGPDNIDLELGDEYHTIDVQNANVVYKRNTTHYKGVFNGKCTLRISDNVKIDFKILQLVPSDIVKKYDRTNIMVEDLQVSAKNEVVFYENGWKIDGFNIRNFDNISLVSESGYDETLTFNFTSTSFMDTRLGVNVRKLRLTVLGDGWKPNQMENTVDVYKTNDWGYVFLYLNIYEPESIFNLTDPKVYIEYLVPEIATTNVLMYEIPDDGRDTYCTADTFYLCYGIDKFLSTDQAERIVTLPYKNNLTLKVNAVSFLNMSKPVDGQILTVLSANVNVYVGVVGLNGGYFAELNMIDHKVRAYANTTIGKLYFSRSVVLDSEYAVIADSVEMNEYTLDRIIGKLVIKKYCRMYDLVSESIKFGNSSYKIDNYYYEIPKLERNVFSYSKDASTLEFSFKYGLSVVSDSINGAEFEFNSDMMIIFRDEKWDSIKINGEIIINCQNHSLTIKSKLYEPRVTIIGESNRIHRATTKNVKVYDSIDVNSEIIYDFSDVKLEEGENPSLYFSRLTFKGDHGITIIKGENCTVSVLNANIEAGSSVKVNSLIIERNLDMKADAVLQTKDSSKSIELKDDNYVLINMDGDLEKLPLINLGEVDSENPKRPQKLKVKIDCSNPVNDMSKWENEGMTLVKGKSFNCESWLPKTYVNFDGDLNFDISDISVVCVDDKDPAMKHLNEETNEMSLKIIKKKKPTSFILQPDTPTKEIIRTNEIIPPAIISNTHEINAKTDIINVQSSHKNDEKSLVPDENPDSLEEGNKNVAAIAGGAAGGVAVVTVVIVVIILVVRKSNKEQSSSSAQMINGNDEI